MWLSKNLQVCHKHLLMHAWTAPTLTNAHEAMFHVCVLYCCWGSKIGKPSGRAGLSIADEQARSAWCQPVGLTRVPSQQLGAIAGWLAPFCSMSLACCPSPLHSLKIGSMTYYQVLLAHMPPKLLKAKGREAICFQKVNLSRSSYQDQPTAPLTGKLPHTLYCCE